MPLRSTPVAAAVAYVAGDEGLGVSVLDAVAQGTDAEAGIYHAVDGADARAGQHADGRPPASGACR